MVNDPEMLNDLMKKIETYFEDPVNVEEFRKYMDEEMKKPYNTHLLCNEICCEHNRPEDPDMGTICWCNKYSNEQEEQCNQECNKRWYWSMDFTPEDAE